MMREPKSPTCKLTNMMAARLTLTDRREGKVSEAAMFESYMVSLIGSYTSEKNKFEWEHSLKIELRSAACCCDSPK